MTSPNPVKCNQCLHFFRPEIENDPKLPSRREGETRLLYLCEAFPDGEGIPLEVLLWNEPHVSQRSDQEGDFVFETTPELIEANPVPFEATI